MLHTINFGKTPKYILFLCASIFIGFLNANTYKSSKENLDHPYYGAYSTNELFVASISLIKTGETFDALGSPGNGCDSILFTYEVTNQSTNGEVLDNVVLTDANLGGIITGPVSGDDNNNTFLDPGETWIYEVGYTITQADIDAGLVNGQANVTADVIGQPGVSVSDISDDNSPTEDDDTIINLTHCQPNISVIKTGLATNATGGLVCDFIDYTFEVSNGSALVILENVVLNDPLLGGDVPGPDSGDDNNNTLLDPGETWIYLVNYTITPTDIANGFVGNQATATADVVGQPGVSVSDLSDDDSPNEDDITITDLSHCQPNISVIKTGLATNATGGLVCDFIDYTFEVSNGSALVILENVVLNDPLLGGDVPGPDSGDDNNNSLLDIGETWIYSAVYTIIPADINTGFVENQATATADVLGQAGVSVSDLSDDNSISENDPTILDLISCQDPSIGLIKEGVVIDANADGCLESILYTFTVVNTGNVDLFELTLEDDLFGGEIPGPVDGTDNNEDGVLSVGETWVYQTVYAITPEDIINQAVINQAQISAFTLSNTLVEDLSDDDSLLEDEPTRTAIPDDACTDGADIGLIKTGELADVDADGCIESIRYTFTVTNTGNIDLEEITLEDELLGGQVPGPVDGTDQGNDGILSVGETWTYTALYAITQQDIDATIVVNQATVSGNLIGSQDTVFDLSDDDSLFEDAVTRTEVPDDACTDGADIGLIKTGELADVDADGCIESIRYTFTVTNTGNIDLEEITLEDELLGGQVPGPVDGTDQGNDGILSVGETWTYTALYAITQQDIDATIVVNQATVSGNLIGSQDTVFDLSDDDSLFEDAVTRTEVPDDACTDGGGANPLYGIAMIKTGVNRDIDLDGCDDSIRYEFTVTNIGSLDLTNVLITDELLGGQINGLVISQESEDGILQPGEEWLFTAIYNLTQEDLSGIFVDNQATVSANIINTNDVTFDYSDDESYFENGITSVNVSDFCPLGEENSNGFEIYNGITPNGDGFNDYFQIVGIENYPDNNLKIFNRWGVLVYEKDNYGQDNDLFYGISQGRATLQKERQLPSGTYFYILTIEGENPGKSNYSGYLYINRN